MKIILSRKGFDSGAGGVASPIMPDGALVSLPIPYKKGRNAFRDISVPDCDLGALAANLTGGKYGSDHPTHLDPDLRAESRPRPAGWRPMFGQSGAAQSHLANQKIGRGDLFLFFGWFRRVEQVATTFRYVVGAPNLHVLFGWLEVGAVYDIATQRDQVPAWAHSHPHLTEVSTVPNMLYVSSEASAGGLGGGVFRRYDEALRLTQSAESPSDHPLRSHWQVPGCLHPSSGRPMLTYHRNEKRWGDPGEHTTVRTVGRGQEFVFDGAHYPDAQRWAVGLIERHGRPGFRSSKEVPHG